MTNFNKDKIAWCITDGSSGMISQVKGLAEALELTYVLKTVELRFPWNKLPVGILPISKIMFKDFKNDVPNESSTNLPDFIISCGKRSVYFSVYLKKLFKNKVFTIHIQNPKVSLKEFDLIVAPNHDNIKGDNVIVTDLAINHINRRMMREISEDEYHRTQIDKGLRENKKNNAAVLVGGESRNYTFDEDVIQDFSYKLCRILDPENLFMTFSRRTGKFIEEKIMRLTNNIINEKMSLGRGHLPIVFTSDINHDGYLRALAFSKIVICTGDSVSMISEAICSGNSVYIYRLPSLKNNNRIELFIETVLQKGYAREFPQEIETFVRAFPNIYKNETEEVASQIYEIYNKK